MKNVPARVPTHARRCILLCACSLLLTACADVRKFTYPPHFIYLDKAEVSSVMFSLAKSMEQLEILIEKSSTGSGTPSVVRADILAELENLETVASQFIPAPDYSIADNEPAGGLSQMRTNHLLLDAHVEDFLDDVARAKQHVKADPPNFFVIGQLTGGCNSCHRRR